MKRLTGLDAGFLWMETPSSAMHVSGLAVYDPSALVEAGRSFGVENLRELVRNRLHVAPPFRQRLVEVPFQLHFPLWIEDPHFHLDNHIRRVAVPAPGGVRELAQLAAELNAIQLDRSRPLWEMWFIEGLEGGRVATLTKVHHAAIDGASGSEITVALFDLSPDVAEHPAPAEPWQPDRVPSDLEMLTYAAQSLARQPFRVLRALRRTAQAALKVGSLAMEEGHGLAALPFTAPTTSLNAAITSARSVAISTVSLADVKRVKNAFGTTVNDVVLALCAGAMRHYFDQRGEEVDGPLLAMVPVSVRPEEHRADMGNQVSAMFTSLATDVADPVERLAAIHGRMRDAKDQHRALGADILTDWAEFAAPAVFGRAMRLYARTGFASRHRPVFNLTISNIPGPPFPLYSAGAKLEANFPLGPIYDGAALNITVMSLEDSLDFGILTCPDVVDDVWIISDGLTETLAELLAAVDALEAAAAEPPADAVLPSTRTLTDRTERAAARDAVVRQPASTIETIDRRAGTSTKATAETTVPRKRAATKQATAEKATAKTTAPPKRAATKQATAKTTAPRKRAATKQASARKATPATKQAATRKATATKATASTTGTAKQAATKKPAAKKAAPTSKRATATKASARATGTTKKASPTPKRAVPTKAAAGTAGKAVATTSTGARGRSDGTNGVGRRRGPSARRGASPVRVTG